MQSLNDNGFKAPKIRHLTADIDITRIYHSNNAKNIFLDGNLEALNKVL